MSGYGTFLGTTYQQKVGAFVAVHILAQRRLRWISPRDDTPLAYSCETGGAGDDVLIELPNSSTIEVQAKHKLGAGNDLIAAVLGVQSRTVASQPVVFAVDRVSTEAVYTTFRQVLGRIRSGRTDNLGSLIGLLSSAGVTTPTLESLHVAVLDLDDEAASELNLAAEILGHLLQKPEQTPAALAVLASDAGEVAAKRLRRSRRDLELLLTQAGIALKPPAPDIYVLQCTGTARELADVDEVASALAVLDARKLREALPGASASTKYEVEHSR